jgi:erythromycin esterase-like protein
MSQDIRDVLTPSCTMLAFGEPTHAEPAFSWIRNDLFVQLAGLGFRSIALETDRVAALAVNAFVQDGVGTLDAVMRDGFSHGFGDREANRALVSWMREYNQDRRAQERLSFHGFDAAMETMSAPSPRRYLERAIAYLGVELDITDLVGADERWDRTEALMDASMSVGATAEAHRLRSIADDLLNSLYRRAPELIAATSRAEWARAKTQLTAGLGLLRYHRQASEDLDQSARWTLLCATRDALMAENLLDIRGEEDRRGGTLVFANNVHLQRNLSRMEMGDMRLEWWSAGAIAASLAGDRYTFVAGSLGRSDALGLGEPDLDTYEGVLQREITSWGLVTTAVTAARTRTDTTPRQGLFPLDRKTYDNADAILHVSAGYAETVAS